MRDPTTDCYKNLLFRAGIVGRMPAILNPGLETGSLFVPQTCNPQGALACSPLSYLCAPAVELLFR